MPERAVTRRAFLLASSALACGAALGPLVGVAPEPAEAEALPGPTLFNINAECYELWKGPCVLTQASGHTYDVGNMAFSLHEGVLQVRPCQ